MWLEAARGLLSKVMLCLEPLLTLPTSAVGWPDNIWVLLQWCLCGLVLLATTAGVPDATGLSVSLPWISTTPEFPGPECTWDCLNNKGFPKKMECTLSSAKKDLAIVERQENGAMMNYRKTAGRQYARHVGEREKLWESYCRSLVGVPAVQQCHHSTQGTGHTRPLGMGYPESSPALGYCCYLSTKERSMLGKNVSIINWVNQKRVNEAFERKLKCSLPLDSKCPFTEPETA